MFSMKDDPLSRSRYSLRSRSLLCADSERVSGRIQVGAYPVQHHIPWSFVRVVVTDGRAEVPAHHGVC